MRDFASHLPLSIVADLVGLDENVSGKMLERVAAAFNALGSMNARTRQALQTAFGLVEYVRTLRPKNLKLGGAGRSSRSPRWPPAC